MYDKGHGVPQNYNQAVHWYKKAAEQGDASAQNNLGIMYAKGQGVPTDDVQAYAWLAVSAVNGNQIAVTNKELVASRLTPEKLTEAEALALRYFNLYTKPRY